MEAGLTCSNRKAGFHWLHHSREVCKVSVGVQIGTDWYQLLLYKDRNKYCKSPQSSWTEELLFSRCDGHCRHCQGGSRALNSSSVPCAGEGKMGQRCGTTGMITAHLCLPQPALTSTGISTGRIPGEPGIAQRRLVRNPSWYQVYKNGRNLDWEIEVSLGEIAPWLVPVRNAVSIADCLTNKVRSPSYGLLPQKKRTQGISQSFPHSRFGTRQRILCSGISSDCKHVTAVHFQKSHFGTFRQHSTAQADQQCAGKTEFPIFKSCP